LQGTLERIRAYIEQRTSVITALIDGGHMRMKPTAKNEEFAKVRCRVGTCSISKICIYTCETAFGFFCPVD
jgi:hypothetical protein